MPNAKPKTILIVPELPKTRSGKIMLAAQGHRGGKWAAPAPWPTTHGHDRPITEEIAPPTRKERVARDR
nr:hypothetical protein [Arthrobacter sp. U41]